MPVALTASRAVDVRSDVRRRAWLGRRSPPSGPRSRSSPAAPRRPRRRVEMSSFDPASCITRPHAQVDSRSSPSDPTVRRDVESMTTSRALTFLSDLTRAQARWLAQPEGRPVRSKPRVLTTSAAWCPSEPSRRIRVDLAAPRPERRRPCPVETGDRASRTCAAFRAGAHDEHWRPVVQEYRGHDRALGRILADPPERRYRRAAATSRRRCRPYPIAITATTTVRGR